jgi:hypothetical protein
MGGMGNMMTNFRQALKDTRVGLDHTVDWDVRVGVERPRLTIPVVICNVVSVWAIGDGARWRGSRSRLSGTEDVRLGVVVRHGLTLEESVDSPDFELETS